MTIVFPLQSKGSERLGLFKSRRKASPTASVCVQTRNEKTHPFYALASSLACTSADRQLFRSLRESVPVIDSAVSKIVRLTGGFSIKTGNSAVDEKMKDFFENISVGGNQTGIESYIANYLDQLLTYGSAAGEIVADKNGVYALYNVALEDLVVKRDKNGIDLKFFTSSPGNQTQIKYPNLINFSVINPAPGEIYGTSLLKGLPFVSDILLKIYSTIGTNWERVGNLRYAVTYKPNGENDSFSAKERAMQIANAWSDAMKSGSSVKDFVAVGDVGIKVIGADNQILDSEVPVRQMLEQIVAKIGIPPFMLGLNWSTTERMAAVQADMLTSELEYYRRTLTPVIQKIANIWLAVNGISLRAYVEWDDVSLQDEVDVAKARLYNAQADKTEKEVELCKTE